MATQTVTKPAVDFEVSEPDLPNGPVAASFVGGGIGAAVLGIVTILSEVSTPFSNALNWYKPAGPLTGKVIIAVVAFFGSWIALHFAIGRKNVNFSTYATVAFVLLAIGLLGTFPPVFDLLKGG